MSERLRTISVITIRFGFSVLTNGIILEWKFASVDPISSYDETDLTGAGELMALLATGKKLIRDLETHGALGVYVPLEGGFEGRYQRRIRAAGYESLSITARGLGDVAAYLTGVHGVRPPHLGKKNTNAGAAVGYRYFIPPIVTYNLEQLPTHSRGLLLWIIEGNILSSQEIEYLTTLPQVEPRLKLVVELGGERYFRWQPLKQALVTA